MSRQTRFLLIPFCLFALIAPSVTLAGTPAPTHRLYRPGGIGLGALSLAGLAPRHAPTRLREMLSNMPPIPPGPQPVENWSRVAYQYSSDGNWDIYTKRPDGMEERFLIGGPSQDGRPRQSLADGRVAFVSDRSGNFDIFAVAKDGTDLSQLTSDPAEDNYPSWSPDGKQLAFASTRYGSWDILIVNADGSGLLPVTSGAETDSMPAWSPDGKSIAWVRSVAETGRLWMANADGSDAHPISEELRWLENPAWSPDGRRIGFDYDYDWNGFSDVADLPADGTTTDPSPIYSSSGTVDGWMGSYSPDGARAVLTRVEYVAADGQLRIQRADVMDKTLNSNPLEDGLYLTYGVVCTDPDWQRTDFTPPSSRLNAPPHLAASGPGVSLSWSGTDAGGSGIASYDLEYRTGDGPWQTSYHGLTSTGATFSGHPGDVVSFRVRARDAAGNVEPWPGPTNGEGQTTFYNERYRGTVYDNREEPVPGARIEGPRDPDIPFISAHDGSYEVFSFSSIPYIRAAAEGYGPLLPSNSPAASNEWFDFALPPEVNAVENGGFEDGLTGWQILGSEGIATVTNDNWLIHSGQGAVKLGKYSEGPATYAMSTSVTVPEASKNPTLSFFMRPSHPNAAPVPVRVTVAALGEPANALTLHFPDTVWWRHAWADLGDWGGKPVTLTLEVNLEGGEFEGTMVFDEISVGEWHTPRIAGNALFLPMIVTGESEFTADDSSPAVN